jgi:hypothetical protein
MRQERRRSPSASSPVTGALLSYGLGALFVIAFIVAWLVRMDASWVADVVDSVFPGLVDALRDPS